MELGGRQKRKKNDRESTILKCITFSGRGHTDMY
jgi:hypothetical protein